MKRLKNTVILLQGTYTPLVNAHAGRTQIVSANVARGARSTAKVDVTQLKRVINGS